LRIARRPRLRRTRRGPLELVDVEPQGRVGSPPDRPRLAFEKTLRLGQGPAEQMEGLSQVGAGLWLLGVGPEHEREALARLADVAMEHEVGKQRLQARGLDRADRLALDGEAEAAKQTHVQR
jgi:hypothetical protein